jgi:RNA polymerase sigma-70 factor (ECF subfamily)
MSSRHDAVAEERTEDLDLVRRLRAGDVLAFEEFFEAHFQGLYRFVLTRVGRDSELAKELTQSAICTGIEKLDTYRGEAPLYGWLCGICRFEISGHFRRLRRRPPEIDLPDELPSVRGALGSLRFDLLDPENQLQRKQIARLVHSAADALPPRYRWALQWKYLHGMSVKEIALRLELSPKAAESLLTRARSAFREGFESFLAGSTGPVRQAETKP